jgi:hypothetical protein
MAQQIVSKDYVIDPFTGEVTQEVGKIVDNVLEGRSDPIEDLFSDKSNLPIHLKFQKEYNIPVHVMSEYIGNRPDSAKQHLNERIELIGAVPYFSGAYTPKDPSVNDGSGFYTFLIKTSKTREFSYKNGKQIVDVQVPVIIKCDGVKVRDIIAEFIKMWGPYDWKDVTTGDTIKIPVVFTQEPDGAFYIQVLPE